MRSASLPAALSQQLLRALLAFMRAQTDVPRCKIVAAVSRPSGMGSIGSANGVDRQGMSIPNIECRLI